MGKVRRKKRASRRGSREDADVELSTCGEPVAAGEGQTFDSPVNLYITHYRCHLADTDGLSVKAAIDGLVHCGVLRGDTAADIVEVRHRQVKVKNQEEERTEILIREV